MTSDSSASSGPPEKALAVRLAAIPQIRDLSDSTHDEAWTLAQSLIDLADSSRGYLEALPALLSPDASGDTLLQMLMEVALDLQHMLYHLEDPRFLRRLFAPLKAEWDAERD